MNLLFAIGMLLSPVETTAAPNFQYCEITGLALGANKEFVGAVAARIVTKQGLRGNPECQALWSEAFQTGKRLSAGGPWSYVDGTRWDKLQEFEAQVLDSVIRDMGMGEQP